MDRSPDPASVSRDKSSGSKSSKSPGNKQRSPSTASSKKRKPDDDDEFLEARPNPKRSLVLATNGSPSSTIHQFLKPSPGSTQSSSASPPKKAKKPEVIVLDDDSPPLVEDDYDWLHTPVFKPSTDPLRSTPTHTPSEASTQPTSVEPSPKKRGLSSSIASSQTTLSISTHASSSQVVAKPKHPEQKEQKRTASVLMKPASIIPVSAQTAPVPKPRSITLTTPVDNAKPFMAWCDKYAPKTIASIAMQKAKLSDLSDALVGMLHACKLSRNSAQPLPGTRVLILTGPTGTAKSTAIRLLLGSGLIKELHPVETFDFELVEYKTAGGSAPTSLQDLEERKFGYSASGNSFVVSSQYESKLKPFLEQVDGSRYPVVVMQERAFGTSAPPSQVVSSAPTTPKMRVLFVDDMPYLHDWRQKADFQAAIKKILSAHYFHPIVFVLSHSSSSDSSTPWQLFSRDILDHPSVKMLEFNPVANTIIKRTLTAILKEENVVLPVEDIQALVHTASGDIRSAVNTLQWMVEHGMRENGAKRKTVGKQLVAGAQKLIPSGPEYQKTEIMQKVNKSGKEEYVKVSVFASLARDMSLSLFHSLGKIMYNKRLKAGDIDDAGVTVVELGDHKTIPKTSPLFRMPLKASPETIHASNVGHDSSGGLLMHYMHENYLKFFSELDEAAQAADYLASADTFSSVFYGRDVAQITNEYADLVAMRGILFANAHPKERSFTSLVKPSSLQAFRSLRENREILDLIYVTPNLTYDNSPITLERRQAANKKEDSQIEVDILGSALLPAHWSCMLTRWEIACDLMPYHGFLLKEVKLAGTRHTLFFSLKSLLRPSEASFVEIMCRFSGSMRSGSSSSTLLEASTVYDADEEENAAKERDRKRNIMDNIFRDRRSSPMASVAPAQGNTLFHHGTTAIASSYAAPKNTSSFRFGRQTAAPPAPPMNSTPVIEILDDIEDV